MTACRGCGESDFERVLDLGKVPAADHFPLATEPVRADEASHSLAMDVCRACGLAQLADDDTVTNEPRGVEPQALKDQAEAAIQRVAAAGWLRGDTVLEFGSPHGGTLDPAAHRPRVHYSLVAGGRGARLLRHHARAGPAQRLRPARTGHHTDGVLLLQYHSIVTIVAAGPVECVAARALRLLLANHADAAARRGAACASSPHGSSTCTAGRCCSRLSMGKPNPTSRCCASSRPKTRWASPARMSSVDSNDRADQHAESLRSWLEEEADAGRTVLAYGAASRAVALFSRAGIDSRLLSAVADASPAKQGRRMPGTDIPIVSPDELLAAKPDRVLLTVPDLLPEVSARFPELDGRWKVDGQ